MSEVSTRAMKAPGKAWQKEINAASSPVRLLCVCVCVCVCPKQKEINAASSPVQDLGFRVWDSGFRVSCSAIEVWRVGFRVQVFGFA